MYDLLVKALKKNRFSYLSFIFLLIIFVLPNTGLSQISQTAVPFLLMPPDAYGQGMGYGGSAFSSGAVSSYYNPANLVTVNSLSAEISRKTVLPQLADDFIYKNVYVAGLIEDEFYVGIGLNYMNYGEQERGDETISSYDLALNFSGAIRFDTTVSVGVTAKYIKSHLSYYGADASSIALDLGVLFRNLFPDATYSSNKTYYKNLRRKFRERESRGITIGVSVANLGPGMSYIDDDVTDPLPRNFRVGMGYQAVDIEQLGLRFTIDATKLLVNMDDGFNTEWQEIDWAYGAEATFYYLVSLRAGRHLDRSDYDKFWTIGLGLGPEWLRINYSRVLESEDHYNRRVGEDTYSLYCNLPARFLNW